MLKVTVTEHGKVVVVTLEGDMVFNELMELEQMMTNIIDKNPEVIGLDCKNLDILDSSGLGIMIKFSKTANDLNILFKIIDVTKNITKIFDVSKMDEFFDTVSREEFENNYLG